MTPSVLVAAGARKGTLTRDVIEKILRWNALYGEPPSTADWNPSLARWRAQEWRIERYRLGDPDTGERWPSLNAAKRLFDGSFDAAIREAGLVPHRPGPRRRAAGAALPLVEQRAPQGPRDVEAELAAAAERVLDAERRALRAEERTQRALARAERAESHAAEQRDRVRGAERRATERVRTAERHVTVSERRIAQLTEAAQAAREADLRAEEAERARTDAEARATEAEAALAVAEARTTRAADAGRRASEVLAARRAEAERDRAVARAEAAERRVRELAAADRLPAADIAALRRRGSGPTGPGPLAEALKALATARARNDSTRLHRALTDVATAAVRWRERL
jgi:hypothetical protein